MTLEHTYEQYDSKHSPAEHGHCFLVVFRSPRYVTITSTKEYNFWRNRAPFEQNWKKTATKAWIVTVHTHPLKYDGATACNVWYSWVPDVLALPSLVQIHFSPLVSSHRCTSPCFLDSQI